MSLGDEIKTAEVIAEEVTNTTTPEASVGTLLEWIISLFHSISKASDPQAAAATHAATLEAMKPTLAAAVAANPT